MQRIAKARLLTTELGACRPRGRQLRVVKLSTLREFLSRCGNELQVLTALAESVDDSLVTMVDSTAVKVALVSYRQEKRASDAPSPADSNACALFGAQYNALSLDGYALHHVIKAAETLRCEALWLDAWCYKPSSSGYDHEDFCHTLHDVMESIVAVVWLPRSKYDNANGSEYAYRLWCTFEAACVQQHCLPVAIAGNMSCFQVAVRRCGSWTPSLMRTDSVLSELGRLNLAFYMGTIFMLYDLLVALSLGNFYDFTGLVPYVFFINPIFWFAFRATIGQQLRLARNAQRVSKRAYGESLCA